jgi:DedD protein
MATGQSARTRGRAADSEDGAGDPALPQKKRARHRLIGAVALCLVALVVVPLLLESEPSLPVSDVTIAVPSRDTPLPPPQPADTRADARTESARNPGAAARGVIEQPTADGADRPPSDAKPGAPKAVESKAADTKAADTKAADTKAGDTKAADTKAADTKAADAKSAGAKSADAKGADAKSADAKGVDAKSPPSGPRADSKPDEIQRLAEAAQARARGETLGRYLLQVGAFASQTSANAAVERVNATGQPGFTETIKTDRGERIRVRVGPYPSRESAERAREKLKAAGIEAAVIAP